MKTLIVKSAVATLFVAFACVASSSTVMGQDSGGGMVAVLDVAQVFQSNPSFTQKMERIKSEAESLRKQIQEQQENIRSRAEAVAGLGVGTSDRNQKEAQLEQEQAALKTKARQAEGDLLKREAQIYHDTYVQVQDIVGKMATQYNIALVLRFDSTPIDRENRGEVIKGVNRQVVFHHKLDLTKLVIEQLNPAAAQRATGTTNK